MSADLLKQAQAGDAVAAAQLWRLIADGKADGAIVAAWAQDVAQQVVSKVLDNPDPANRRAEKALAVLGLEGRRSDPNRDLADHVALTPGYSARELAEVADLLVDTQGRTPDQVKRAIEHIRKSAKK